MITKPMLAVAVKDLDSIKYPVLVSKKLDGTRCMIVDGKALTRKFKPIPNDFVRKTLEGFPNGLDGEIMVEGKNFNEVQSLIMSKEGAPLFQYHIFDWVQKDLKEPFVKRYEKYMSRFNIQAPNDILQPLSQELVDSKEKLLALEKIAISYGYEGLMIRSINSPYKCGRSTLREGYLLKLKRFFDSEAIIINRKEKMHNANEAEKDELGHTKRSQKKEGMIGTESLGAWEVQDIKTKVIFDIGTGFTQEQRKEFWNNSEKYTDKIVKYKYQELGPNGKPRFPVFLGFRAKEDM